MWAVLNSWSITAGKNGVTPCKTNDLKTHKCSRTTITTWNVMTQDKWTMCSILLIADNGNKANSCKAMKQCLMCTDIYKHIFFTYLYDSTIQSHIENTLFTSFSHFIHSPKWWNVTSKQIIHILIRMGSWECSRHYIIMIFAAVFSIEQQGLSAFNLWL